MNARVPVRGVGDELDRLSALFNAMLDRIRQLVGAMQDSLDDVAHDLRTPLTRLRAMAEFTLQGNSSVPALRDALANCVEQSDHIIATLNTLMAVAEAEAGAMALSRENVDLGDLVRRTVDLYREVSEDKQIQVDIEEMAPLLVPADRVRLQQVLANVLDNALKYTPLGGRIRIEAGPRGDYAALAITDSGPGFAPDELERVFDRLYRGDQSRSQTGLGLGLSLVRAIAGAHGGTVAATNVEPRGACVSILLPIERVI